MKTRKLYLSVFIFIVSIVFAQAFEPKFYSSILDGDYNLNHSGIAGAEYLGHATVSDKEVISEFSKNFSDYYPIKKLTKNNSWLMKKAINEYEYKENEYYLVLCIDSPDAKASSILLVKITGKDKFDWHGFIVPIESSPENVSFMSLFD